MHSFQTVLFVLVAAAILYAIWMAVRSSIEERREQRDKRKRAGVQQGAMCEPAHCDHRWFEWESGTCTPSYSSYGGPSLQETWTVEQCARCGIRRFSCTGTCDCRVECAAPYSAP